MPEKRVARPASGAAKRGWCAARCLWLSTDEEDLGMPVKYGVIGCGAIGQRRHIPECVANPESVLIAVADANPARVQEISK